MPDIPSNLSKPPARACVIFFAAAISFIVHAQAGEAPSEAARKVREFEMRMGEQMRTENGYEEKIRDTEAFRNTVRGFFAGLENSEIRLEAIDMLDGRYVYIVSRDFASELLGPLIRDDDPAVRIRAARAIGYNGCGARYAEELITMTEGETSVEALVNVAYAMGSSEHQPFVSYLEKMLGHANGEVRSKASDAITQLAPMTAFNHNLRLLDDAEPSVRSAAIRNIASPSGNVIVTSLMRMLDDKDPKVRENALQALGKQNAPHSADAIKERLSDEHHHVRSQAALVLGQMRKHPWHVAALLKDQDVVVRRRAAIGMGLMADAHYIPALTPLLDDEDDQVREYAAKAISQLEALKTDGK